MTDDQDRLTPLKEIIEGLLKDERLPFNPEDARIWNIWDDAVGPAIARNARPLWIHKGKLRVAVGDPIWLQELKFAEAQIREKLNARLGREAVSKIEFRAGPG